MRLLSLLSLLLLLTIGATETVMACDCSTRSPSESFRNADVVFEGEVIKIENLSQGTAYTFKVHKSLKNAATSEVIIFAGMTNCDSHFRPDVTYRVFARTFEGKLSTGICAGNEILEIRTVNSAQVMTPDASPWQSWQAKVVAVIGVSSLLCLLIWFWPGGKRHALVRLEGLDGYTRIEKTTRAAYRDNAPGPFYSECDGCLLCEAPHAEAPELMAWYIDPSGTNHESHCFFKRQPETPEEVQHAINAMRVSCVENLRYRGDDPEILETLSRMGYRHLCDELE